MPELYERVYEWLCRKSKSSATAKLRCGGILLKLRTEIVDDPVELRKALIRLRSDSLIKYAAGAHGEPISGFMTVQRPAVEVPPYVEKWGAALEDSGLSDADKAALRPMGSGVEGFSIENMKTLINGLKRLRENQAQHYGAQVFSVSAMYLMGSSKLLSTLDGKALRAFGIELERFSPRPFYVVVGGYTESPEAVVLIENPVSFEAAVNSSAAAKHLFVCTFGFGLSATTNDFGNQLAGAVEAGQARVLNRSPGVVPTLQDILQHQRIHFWGDLDTAGMQIYCRLASKVPAICLSALYEPMIEAIKREEARHPYVTAAAKEGQGRMTVQTDRGDVKKLLRLCERFAVDQEVVQEAEIDLLAGAPLQLT